ncbi:MAG: hypothetical protein K5644_04585 [Lachnospiraceae bacterium]|nr:hypothetical protein [Lachnospiraceae bacterium]
MRNICFEETKKIIVLLYNKGNGEHFYTASPSEKSWLICTYWDYEGIVWYGM